MRRTFKLALFATPALALSACASSVEVQPQPARPAPIPAPAPPPRPQPLPAPPPRADWRDWPLTPGGWSYRQDERGSIALFGRAGGDADFTIRCDRARARVLLSRRGDGAGPLTVRTSSTLRSLPVAPVGGLPAYLTAELGARDPLLDAIGYSRGRIVIEGAGLPALAIPAWAELLRVVEDCR